MSALKSITDIKVEDFTPWLGYAFITFALTIPISIAVGVLVSHSEYVLLSVICSGTVAGSYFMNKYWSQYQEQKRIWLQVVVNSPLELLIKATASPELDGDTKRELVQYLNSQHPGWSLQ